MYNKINAIVCFLSFSMGVLFTSVGFSTKELIAVVASAFGVSFAIVFSIIYLLTKEQSMRDSVISHVTSACAGMFTDNQRIFQELMKLGQELMKSASDFHSKFFQSGSKKIEEAKLIKGATVMNIPFLFRNKEYELLVPYSGSMARNNIVYSLVKDDSRETLKHHSGIKLLVTTEDMEVDNILSEKLTNSKEFAEHLW
jgi:hypothetical protein